MFGILKAARRKKTLERPMPEEWLDHVTEYLPIFDLLSEEEARGFLHHLRILVWEKHWVAAGDFALTERVKVIIAAQGARMARGLPEDIFDRLSELVIYGEDFVRPDDDIPGPMLGEAHPFGTVVLSWPAVEESLRYPCVALNPAIHELAHILDMASGYFDGTPVLHRGADYEVWAEVFTRHFEEKWDRPEESFLDDYGVADASEFFAVTVEAFFDLPDVMAEETPDLFEVLCNYFRITPIAIPCSCESHEEPEGEDDVEEVGRPFWMPPDPLDGAF